MPCRPPRRSSGRSTFPRHRRCRRTVDVAVIARQVVLGEQVDDQRCARLHSPETAMDPTRRRPARHRSCGHRSMARTHAGTNRAQPWRWRSSSRPTTGSSSVSSSICVQGRIGRSLRSRRLRHRRLCSSPRIASVSRAMLLPPTPRRRGRSGRRTHTAHPDRPTRTSRRDQSGRTSPASCAIRPMR